MVSDWQEVTLGDLFKVKHGFAFKGEFFTDEPSNNLLVTPGNFAIGGGFQNTKPKYYEGPVPKDYVLEPGQVIVTMTDLSKQSDTLGLAAIIPDDEFTWLHNQRVGLLEFSKNVPTDPRFISYLLRSHNYRSWVIGSASGTTVKHTSPTRIEDFECEIPQLEEQKTIANILGSLDDKIELNRQMNATLEAMAQALFKSWFVDFDPVIDKAIAAGNPIPETFQARAAARQALGDKRKPLPPDIQKLFGDRLVFNDDLNWIPEGWEASPLDKIAHYQNGLALQNFRPENEDDFLPVVKIAQLKKGRADGEEKASPKIKSECIIDDGDIIFSWSGSLMVDIWCGGRGALNQHLFKVTSKNYPKWFFHQFTKHHLQEFQRIASDKAVTMGHIKREHLSQAYCASPDLKLLKVLDTHFNSLMNRGIANRVENRQLEQLRDSLLPKLLSGQIRIPDAEALVAEAI